MHTEREPPIRRGRAAVTALAFVLLPAAGLHAALAAGNLFSNPGFEALGPDRAAWRLDRGGQTEGEFSVDRQEPGEGLRCTRVRLGRTSEWGAQFGQQVAAGKPGRSYTFAVLAQAVAKPVTVDLQIERCAKPYDRAARGGPFTLAPGKWTELHVTFSVEQEFPQGWFAYVSSTQPDCEFRVDAFRLCEGPYVPFEQLARADDAAAGVTVTQTGDAVSVSNAFVELRIRRGTAGVETLVRRGGAPSAGPRLVPAAGEGDAATSIAGFRVVESRANRALVETRAVSATGRNLVTRFLLRKNSPVIEAQPGDGMERLRVEARSRYAVVPDIFAGDLVIDAKAVRPDRLRLPGENVVAQLADGGDALVVCAWRSPAQAARLTLGGGDGDRAFAATEVGCQGSNPVAVAVLAAPGIWQWKRIAELDAVKDAKFDRPVPFRALWRANCRREDGLIDSWKLVIRRPDGSWEGFGVEISKPKTRTVWTSARGTFAYPAALDGESALLRRSRFDGPANLVYRTNDVAIVYPFRIVDGSPEMARGVFDVLQEALAGTPAEQRLEEWTVRRVPRDRYPATCAVTADYEAIFAAGEEQAKKQHLLERLKDMDQFVIGIRSRIDEYLAWRKATAAFIAARKAASPSLAPLADEFAGVLGRFDRRYQELQLDARTPAAAQALIAKVQALIDSDAPDKAEQAKQLGRDTRTVGGNQDHAIGDFRMLTKELRQRAGYRLLEADDAAAFEFARAVRERTLEVLSCAFGHEGAATD